MRVLLVNTHKDHASTGKIAYGLTEELNKRGHEALLLYGLDVDHLETTNTIRLSNWFEFFFHHVYNVLTGYQSTWAPLPFRRFKKAYEEFKPDIVQLYNIHGYYMDDYKMFDFLAEKKVPIVYGMLDEYAYMGYCAYSYECNQFKTGCRNCESIKFRGYFGSLIFNRARETFLLKQKAYDKNDIVFTGPKWVLERAKESALLKNKRLVEIDEYIDTEHTFIPRDKAKIRNQLGIMEDEVMVLNVAPSSDPRKGIKDFIFFAKECNNKKIKFVNVGNQEDPQTLPDNYIGISFVANQIELAEYYSAADILFCTSHADTMPNVCLDALSCGTQVMGYNLTGIPYVANEPLGKFFNPKDKKNILKYIESLSRKTPEMEEKCREYAVSRYSKETYTNKQISLYEEILKNRK